MIISKVKNEKCEVLLYLIIIREKDPFYTLLIMKRLFKYISGNL